MIILQVVAFVLLFFYISIGGTLALLDEHNSVKLRVILCPVYAIFWAPILIATWIKGRWGA